MATSSTSLAPADLKRPARSYEIDWLRVLATLLVFLYHSSRPFNLMENWHVKNPVLSMGFDVPLVVFGVWAMPLFFVLSGISSYYSLRARGALEFLRLEIGRAHV
jgi:peptidoglycan/LPS O-acetylase OafA/YrhL